MAEERASLTLVRVSTLRESVSWRGQRFIKNSNLQVLWVSTPIMWGKMVELALKSAVIRRARCWMLEGYGTAQRKVGIIPASTQNHAIPHLHSKMPFCTEASNRQDRKVEVRAEAWLGFPS